MADVRDTQFVVGLSGQQKIHSPYSPPLHAAAADNK